MIRFLLVHANAVAISPANKSCGVASKALVIPCAKFYSEEVTKAASNWVLMGDNSVSCNLTSIGNVNDLDNENPFDPIFLTFTAFLYLRHWQKKTNLRSQMISKDRGQVKQFIWSISSVFGGVLSFTAFALIFKKALDKWVFSNTTRAIMHGAQATIVGMNLIYNTKLKNRLKTEIAEIESYLTKIELAISTPEDLTSGERMALEQEVGRDFESQFRQEFGDAFGKEKSPCPKGGDGKGGCMKIRPMMSQVIGGLGLDGLVGQTSNDVAKYADLTANKNKLDSNALKLGQKIAAAKGPLDKLKKKLMKKYNAMRVKDGQKPINFEKLSGNLLQTLKSKFYEATGQSANASVANLDKKAKKEKPFANAKKKVAAADKKDGKAGAEANGFSFNFQKQKEEGISDGNVVDDTDADQYTVGDADITKGTSKDIFKVITTRYFKSAYPVLVEELK